MAAVRHIAFVGSHGTAHAGLFVVRTPVQKYGFQVFNEFLSFRLESPVHAAKISVFLGLTNKI